MLIAVGFDWEVSEATACRIVHRVETAPITDCELKA